MRLAPMGVGRPQRCVASVEPVLVLVFEMGEIRFGREEEEEEGVGGSVDCRVSIPSPEGGCRTAYTLGEQLPVYRGMSAAAHTRDDEARVCARHLFDRRGRGGPSLHASWSSSLEPAYFCLAYLVYITG